MRPRSLPCEELAMSYNTIRWGNSLVFLTVWKIPASGRTTLGTQRELDWKWSSLDLDNTRASSIVSWPLKREFSFSYVSHSKL